MGSKGERPDDYTNLDEAKQLLADAGYPDGFDVDMTVSDLDMEGILLTDLAQKVKDDLSQIGINVNIKTEAWAAGYGDEYRNGTLGFTVMYWGVDYSDPNVQLEFLPGGVVGKRAGWTADMNQDLAALYEDAMAATDDTERADVLGKIQDEMYEDGPFIVIAQAPAHIAHSSRLAGVDIFDAYTIDLTEINVQGILVDSLLLRHQLPGEQAVDGQYYHRDNGNLERIQHGNHILWMITDDTLIHTI